jgi:hypothetical protein
MLWILLSNLFPFFLNDIEKNTIFTHNPANAKGVSNYDIVDKSYLSSLHIIERWYV